MKTRNLKLGLIMGMSVTILAACGGTSSSASAPIDSSTTSGISTSVTSVTSSTPSTSTSSASSSNNVAKASLSEAMRKTYSNMTVGVTQVNEEAEEVAVEYYYDGYVVVQDSLAQEDNEGNVDYLYYHDYNNESYMWFEADSTVENAKSGWLNKGFRDAPLGLENTYFSFDYFKSNFDADDISYINGKYYTNDKDLIKTYRDTFFKFAWNNIPSYVQFTVNDDGYLSNILAFDDPNDEEIYVSIDLYAIGTTEFVGTLPIAPSKDNVIEYWQYKGWDGPWVDVYADTASIKIENETYLKDEENGFDAVLDLDQTLDISYLVGPDNINYYYSSELKSSIPGIVSIKSKGNKLYEIKGEVGGVTEVYLEVDAGNGVTVKSNVIKVKVNGLPEQNKEDAIYDFTFTGMDEENKEILTTNKVENNLPYTVTYTASKDRVYLNDGKNSDGAFSKGEMPIIVNPGSGSPNDGTPSVTFDFGEQQVSSISLYYAMFWDDHMSNLNYLSELSLETSNDGTNWTILSILDDVKANISYSHKKLLETEFAPASKVRFVAKANFIGKAISFAMSDIAFMKNDECIDYVAPEDIHVESVTVSTAGDKDNLFVGKTLEMSANVKPANAYEKTVTWASSNTNVATIDANGVVTGLTAGTTEITATAGGITSAPVVVTVKALPDLDSNITGSFKYVDETNTLLLTFADTSLTAVLNGTSYSLTYTDYENGSLARDQLHVFTDENGNHVKVRYNSYDKVVCADVLLGSVDVYFEAEKYVAASAITLSATDNRTELVVGMSGVGINAAFTPTSATGSMVKNLTWTSTNEDVATVRDGFVKPVAAGTTTIRATNDEGVYGEIVITVRDEILVTAIEADDISLEEGQNAQIVYTITPTTADKKDVTFKSNDTSVATVNSKTGLVTAKSAGETTVTITHTKSDRTVVTKDVKITVTAGTGVIDNKFVGTWEDNIIDNLLLTISVEGENVTAIVEYEGEEIYRFTNYEVDGETIIFTDDNENELKVKMGTIYLEVTINGGEYDLYIYSEIDGNNFSKK